MNGHPPIADPLERDGLGSYDGDEADALRAAHEYTPTDAPRFMVHETWGFPIRPGRERISGHAQPSCTFSVHDAAVNYQTVAQWRTEDRLTRRVGRHVRMRTRAEKILMLRARAYALADRLNRG